MMRDVRESEREIYGLVKVSLARDMIGQQYAWKFY